MAREPTRAVPVRTNQPLAGSPSSSIRGSRTWYPSPSTYSAWVRLRLAIQAPAASTVTTPARRESPRPAATIRSTSGPRPKTSRLPSASSLFWPDAVLTWVLSGIVSCLR